LRAFAQRPNDKFAFELESRHEEEDGQQAVGRPGFKGQVEVECGGPDDEVFEALVRLPPSRVGDDKAGNGSDEQQCATDSLLTQGVGKEGSLTEREASEEDASRWWGRWR
jgi:hypothetical protein